MIKLSFFSVDGGKKNFLRVVICSGVVRSNWIAEFDSGDALNSGSKGVDGCSMIAPIGAHSDEFRMTRWPLSATCLSKTASLIPPPRFVRRSSTSELRSVSIFSGKLGAASAAFDGIAGAETTGGVEALPAAVGMGEICCGPGVPGARLGGVCFTRYNSHRTSPTTERATAIQAVRSIKGHAEKAIHKRTACSGDAGCRISATGPDHDPPRPRVDIALIASTRGSFHEQRRASLPLPKNTPNRSG